MAVSPCLLCCETTDGSVSKMVKTRERKSYQQDQPEHRPQGAIRQARRKRRLAGLGTLAASGVAGHVAGGKCKETAMRPTAGLFHPSRGPGG